MIAIQVFLVLASLGYLAYSCFHAYDSKTEKFSLKKTLPGVVLLFATLFIILPSFGQVPAGYRGVVLRFGAVTGEVKNEGLYFVTPFINSIQLMNVQVHADKSKATAASRDSRMSPPR